MKKVDAINSNRRIILGSIGVAAGLGITRAGDWFGGGASGLSFSELFQVFEQSLSPIQREYTFLASDHPARQVSLTQVVHTGPHIGTLFDNYQIGLIREMYQQMLSAQGKSWLQNTINLEGRFAGSIFKIYSDDIRGATAQNSQVVINGGHYLLRSTDLKSSGYALGGPVSYGQQLGDHKYQVEGNAYKAHGDALNQFHQALNEQEKLSAYQAVPPYELQLQIQGADGIFPGVRIGDVSGAAKELAQDMFATVFSGFTSAQQKEAREAIDANGGIESLHVAMYSDFSFYDDGERYGELKPEQRNARPLPYVQVWRIEGPAMVIHFQGYPHVHAYMNIVRDPSKIAIGEALTHTKASLGLSEVGRLINAVLKQRTEAPLAFYPNSLLGRVSPGTVSTGSIYTLDPFANKIVIADIEFEAMSAELRNSLDMQGTKPVKGARYRVATIDYMLMRKDLFGIPEQVTYTDEILRDQLISFVTDKDLGDIIG